MKTVVALLLVAAVCSAKTLVKRAGGGGGQNPKVFTALDQMRGGVNRQLTVDQIQELFYNVRPGQDFPLIAELPTPNVDCASFKQPGFYADADAGQCQIFNRCDVNGNLTNYLCPNMTLFNQITLVCDWWYNVDCAQAKSFYDYSNSRLYQPVPLLDDENDYVMQVTQAQAAGQTIQSNKPSRASKKRNGKARRARQ